MERKQAFSIWYFLIAVTAVMLLQDFFGRQHAQPIAYSEFKQLLRAGKLAEVALTDQLITGTLSAEGLEGVLPKARADAIGKGQGPHRFTTVRVDDPQLIADLEAAKVSYAGQIESKWLATLLSWIVPALVFFALWSFLIRRMGMGGHGGVLEIGKSKAKVYLEKQTGVTFADVAGIDEAKQELMEIVEFLRSPERYRRLGGKIPKGVLIVGAPGTGKTLLAKAVAGEAGVPFLTISGSDFVEMFVGVGAARVRDLFKQAEEKAPCIIFIDELDALGKARGVGVWGGHDEREQTLNQLLVEMDGFESNRGVIIMAATNRPEILDPALLRPGRFDRHVAIDKPDLKGRRAILAVHTRNVKLAPEVDLERVAALTPGFAGADLANLVNEAALRAAREDKGAVDMRDFDAALDRIVAGLEKKNRVMNPKEKETVAYHEAGHAIVAESRTYADRVAKVSIIPRGIGALGYTQQQPTEDRYLLKQSELLDRIDVLLAGRVAEEIVFGDVSTGAQNDLARATDIARSMVSRYGMSAELGLAAFEEPRTTPFLNTPLPEGIRSYSERTAQAIDAEVRKILSEARERVRQTLAAKRAALDALAKRLLEQEVVERAALVDLLAALPEALPRAACARE
ncbi:MAG: ATP-dependent zinc metalloprotease FtsH [Burkholderiaceae bacterium]|nr:ATP-dependent zinc metalloprotease FtsH [Burkholderiaceae bacterium]GIL06430.1 MAG: ATP-dependent zinc metalloprotease FtsH [Betaproteobacteria bacterium]